MTAYEMKVKKKKFLRVLHTWLVVHAARPCLSAYAALYSIEFRKKGEKET